MTQPQSQTIEFILYRHGESRDKAVLLSPDGDRFRAEWVPRSLLVEPAMLDLVRPHGEAVSRGKFKMATFKARELGWLETAGEAQLGLL